MTRKSSRLSKAPTAAQPVAKAPKVTKHGLSDVPGSLGEVVSAELINFLFSAGRMVEGHAMLKRHEKLEASK